MGGVRSPGSPCGAPRSAIIRALPLAFQPKNKHCLTMGGAAGEAKSGPAGALPLSTILPLPGSSRRGRALACRAARTSTRTAQETAFLDDECPPMRVPSYLGLALTILGAFGAVPSARGEEPAPVRLEVLPASVRLSGPEAAQRLVVIGIDSRREHDSDVTVAGTIRGGGRPRGRPGR